MSFYLFSSTFLLFIKSVFLFLILFLFFIKNIIVQPAHTKDRKKRRKKTRLLLECPCCLPSTPYHRIKWAYRLLCVCPQAVSMATAKKTEWQFSRTFTNKPTKQNRIPQLRSYHPGLFSLGSAHKTD